MRCSSSGIGHGWNGCPVEPFTDSLFCGLFTATFGPRFLSFAKFIFSSLNFLVNFTEEVSGRLIFHPASVRPAIRMRGILKQRGTDEAPALPG